MGDFGNSGYKAKQIIDKETNYKSWTNEDYERFEKLQNEIQIKNSGKLSTE